MATSHPGAGHLRGMQPGSGAITQRWLAHSVALTWRIISHHFAPLLPPFAVLVVEQWRSANSVAPLWVAVLSYAVAWALLRPW